MENSFKEHLKNLVKEIKQKKSLKDEILQTWSSINKEYIRHAYPISLTKGVLYLGVEDSNWLYYCFLKKEEIKEDLKQIFLAGKIKEIKFKVRR